ncbi:MAG: copper resistance protein CopC [Cryobacterium sp.]|nr:copper resistance protein CopC [Cryobacterium sp.]
MTRGNTERRWSLRALGGAAVVVAALGGAAAPASAHNSPIGSSPAEGAVVTEQPSLFTVTTNDALLDFGGGGAGSGMLISGPSDAATPLYYGDGCISVLDSTVETAAQLGQPGEYTVTWQVVSTDGHPVSGDFAFTWQPAAGQETAEGSPTKPVCSQGAGAATDAPAAAPDANSAAPTGAALADAAWIAAGLGAVLLAVAGILLATRRRPARRPNRPAQPT